MVGYPHKGRHPYISRAEALEINWSGEGLPSQFKNITAGLAFVQVPQIGGGRIDGVWGLYNTFASDGHPRLVVDVNGYGIHPDASSDYRAIWNLPTSHPLLTSPTWSAGTYWSNSGGTGGTFMSTNDGSSLRGFILDASVVTFFDTSNNNYNLSPATTVSAAQQAGGVTTMGRIGPDRVPTYTQKAVSYGGGTGGANNTWTKATGSALPSVRAFGAIGQIWTNVSQAPVIYMHAVWSRALSDEEDQFWQSNPFCILRPQKLSARPYIAVPTEAVGASAGVGGALGVGAGTDASVGTAAGAGGATGAGQGLGIVAGAGSASGVGAALGDSSYFLFGAGTASGVGAALGDGTSIGIAATTGTSVGVGAATGFSAEFAEVDEAITLAGLVGIAYGEVISAGAGIAQSLSYMYRPGALVTEIVVDQGDVSTAIRYQQLINEIPYLTNAVTRAFPYGLSDTIALADTATAVRALLVIEQLMLDQAISPRMSYRSQMLETLSVTDTLRRFFGGGISETILQTEALTLLRRASGDVEEAFAVSPALTGNLVLRLTANETVNLDDVAPLQMLFSPAVYEGIELTAAHISPGNSITTWAINTRTGAVTEYRNFAFNSFAQVGHKVLAASAGGLYELDGNTDSGADIIANIKSGFMQFSGSRFAAFQAIYLGMRASGNVVLKMTTGDGKTYIYQVKAQSMRTTKVNVGKGLRARYFAFELISTGPDFDLDTVEFLPLIAQRRV